MSGALRSLIADEPHEVRLKMVAGGLLGLTGAAVAGLAELGEIEPEAALAIIAGAVTMATGELERRPS